MLQEDAAHRRIQPTVEDQDDFVDVSNSQDVNMSCSSYYTVDRSSSVYCDPNVDERYQGTLQQPLHYGSSDTLWSADTVYSDAVSDKNVKSDEASLSGHDLQTADEATSDEDLNWRPGFCLHGDYDCPE